jgi:hypothetical protein
LQRGGEQCVAAELRHPCRKRLPSSFHVGSRWLTPFASIRGGVGHTSRCANEIKKTLVHPDYNGEVRGTFVGVTSSEYAAVAVPSSFCEHVRADFSRRTLVNGEDAIAANDIDDDATIEIPLSAVPESHRFPNARLRVVFGVASWTVVAFPDDAEA